MPAKTSEQLAEEAKSLAGVSTNPLDAVPAPPARETGNIPEPVKETGGLPLPVNDPATIQAEKVAVAPVADPEFAEFQRWKENKGAAAPAPAPSTPSVQDAKYGPNPIIATKNGENRKFSQVAWDALLTGEDGTKYGWQQKVQTPPEVAHHNFTNK